MPLELGFTLTPGADDVDGEEGGRLYLSNEQIGVLDADTLVAMQSDLVLGEADALDQIADDPVWSQLPAVVADNVITVDRLDNPVPWFGDGWSTTWSNSSADGPPSRGPAPRPVCDRPPAASIIEGPSVARGAPRVLVDPLVQVRRRHRGRDLPRAARRVGGQARVRQPGAVPVMGPIHGFLFLAYLWLALLVREELGWRLTTTLMVVVAAVIPLGGLYVERRVLADAEPRTARSRGRPSNLDQAFDGLGRLGHLLGRAGGPQRHRVADAVVQVLVEQADGHALQALVTAEICVRTSMQYVSSSTMRCRPRTWPSMRAKRRL